MQNDKTIIGITFIILLFVAMLCNFLVFRKDIFIILKHIMNHINFFKDKSYMNNEDYQERLRNADTNFSLFTKACIIITFSWIAVLFPSIMLWNSYTKNFIDKSFVYVVGENKKVSETNIDIQLNHKNMCTLRLDEKNVVLIPQTKEYEVSKNISKLCMNSEKNYIITFVNGQVVENPYTLFDMLNWNIK